MRATDILKAEHRVIEQVLSCLETLTDEAAATGNVNWTAAGEALDFFQHFADRCHHGKEEDKLFPFLEARGFSPNLGPTSVMRGEHEMGRKLVHEMGEVIAGALAGKPAAVDRFVEPARTYIRLLREHIHKEDHCLFAMADQVLTEKDQDALVESFEDAEQHDMGAGAHEHYLALANDLADRFHVSRPANATATVGFGCNH